MTDIKNKNLFSEFMEPLYDLHEKNPHVRECIKLSDLKWLGIGIKRIMGSDKSGRGFLQSLLYKTGELLSVGLFFETLKSKRRLAYLLHTLESLAFLMQRKRKHADIFEEFNELKKFHIFGGDGHYHESASHDKRVDGTKYSTLHFFLINLRVQALSHLTLGMADEGRKKEHDMHALKRMNIDSLRQFAKTGEKVLYVWDRACLDYQQWLEWKRKGIYFLTRSKKSLKFTVIEEIEVDIEDDNNKGVLGDQIVETKGGIQLRRVIYRCPFRNETYSFLTNLSKKVRPGLVAYIYKCRWGIEKTFDEIKNRMEEQKSWGTHQNTKTAQAIFMCISYNLTLLLEDKACEEGVENTKDKARSKKRLENHIRNSKLNENKISSLLKMEHRVTQRPFAFYRWIRSCIFDSIQWQEAIELLRVSYAQLR